MPKELSANTKQMNSKKRIMVKDRFNKPLNESKFLEIFQEMMLDRMILNQTGEYNKRNERRIIKRISGRNPNTVNLDIKEGLLLTCSVEPEFYLLMQETALKVFGDYIPADELIHELLSWFIYYYLPKNTPKRSKPYAEVKHPSNVAKFERRFKKYYKNIIRPKN